MVGLEVGQVARHDVDQEADGGAAVVGLFPDEGGQFLVEGGRVYRRERGGRGVFSGWGGVGVGVDEGLGLVEAEVEELTGGVEGWQGLECSSWPCMTSMRKRTMTRPSSVSSRTMSAREGVVASGLLA